MNKKEVEKKMGPRYRCLNCGRIWQSSDIIVICPVCRCKPIKIKNGVDTNEVIKAIKRR